MAQSLPTKTREELLKRVLQQKIPVAQACRELGVSRFTFYKWLKRYQEGKELKDKPRQIRRFWRQATPEQEDLVLKLVAKNPTLSKYGIAEKLRQMVDRPVLGAHGVYNVLRRWNLTLPEARLAYAQRMVPIAKPVPWFNRLHLVWEKFIPALAPAPPSYLKGLAKSFLTPFAFSSILGSIFFLWLRMLGGQPLSSQLGLIFASLSLTFGFFFFIYSLKYYFTLVLILGFSRQVSGGNQESSLGGRTSLKEEPLRGSTSLENGNGKGSIWEKIFGIKTNGNGNGHQNGNGNGQRVLAGGLQANLDHVKLERRPFVSIHLPLYNEKRVVERLLTACTALDYPSTSSGQVNYEIVVVDDSTDETTAIVQEFARLHPAGGVAPAAHPRGESFRGKPSLKIIHRDSRAGFKGGALKVALENTDPQAEFIIVFDADFLPYPDTITQFLKYFQSVAGTLDFKVNEGKLGENEGLSGKNTLNNPSSTLINLDNPSPIAAVQGYQWHVLNKSENWITRGVRSEYAGSYVVERSGEEILGSLKQIAGSVYMIRKDILDHYGWGTSITEDFELTLKLYQDGWKVVYTPYVQAPSECVSTIKRLIRQRMRWAEGHTHNIRKMFRELMWGRWEENSKLKTQNSKLDSLGGRTSLEEMPLRGSTSQGKTWVPSRLTLMEKLEFLYLSPYYLQAAFFMLGTFSWFISEAIFQTRLPFWTSLWGWSLVLTNLLALPLMNTVGLFLEESEERDYSGILSFIFLTYLLVPFQAYAAIKGFMEKEEGPWFRTPKTGKITDIFARGRFYRWISGIIPGRRPAPAAISTRRSPLNANSYLALAPSASLGAGTANNRFENFRISSKRAKWIGRTFLVILLLFSTILLSLAPAAPYFIKPQETQAKGFGMLAGPHQTPPRTDLDGQVGGNETEITLEIINPHSHPKEGEDWVVNFKTVGKADLTITSQDQATINDLDFVSLKCDGEERIPQILKDDTIFYQNWSCEGKGEITHLVKVAGRHTLKFQFGNQIEHAYNSPTPSTVGTSTASEPILEENQRKSFYANGRFWVFWSDGTNMVYKTSTDSSTWSDATTVRVAGNGPTFGVTFDGTYIHYVYSNYDGTAAPLYYRRGTPNSDGTITWSAAEQEARPAGYKTYYQYPTVHVDSGGYPIIGYRQFAAAVGAYFPYVTKSSTNDGTWTTATNFPYQLNTTSGNWQVEIIPLTSNKFYAIYLRSPNTPDPVTDSVLGKLWDNGWGSEETVTDLDITMFARKSSVGYSDDVYFAFSENTSYDLHMVKRTYGTGWGSAEDVHLSASSTSYPELSVNADTGDLYAFWGGAPTANHIYYKKRVAGTWDTNPTDWIDESTDQLKGNQFLISYYKDYGSKIGLVYVTKTASPYNIRFDFLVLPVDTSTSANATAYSFQRKTWYDGTRLWSAFYSGSEIEFWYSADWGSTWTQNTSATIAVSTNDFTIEADTADAFITYTNGYDIIANEDTGTYPATNFAWGASPTIVYDGSSGTDEFDYPAISKDSNSKVWITGTHLSGTDYLFKARQSTTANDISAWGTASTLDTSTNSNKYGTIVPSGTGEVYAVWIDATTIEGKEYTSDTWAGSPTTIATGVTGLTNNMSAVSDSSGNVHLLYIDSNDYAVYQEYTTSWQTAVTLDSTAGNDYPTISLNTSNNDLYALWIRSNVIYYKKGVSPYASANWDASATSWKSTGTNAWVTSNYSGAGMIFAQWTSGSASPYSVMWDYIIIPEKIWFLLGLGLAIPAWIKRKKKLGYRV